MHLVGRHLQLYKRCTDTRMSNGASLFLLLWMETRLHGSQANTDYTMPDPMRQTVMLTLPEPWTYTDGADIHRCSFLTSPLEGGEWLTALPPHKEPRYPLNRKLYGSQSRYGRLDKQKTQLTPTGFELQPVQFVAWSLYWVLWREVNWILRLAVSKVRLSIKAKFSLLSAIVHIYFSLIVTADFCAFKFQTILSCLLILKYSDCNEK